MFAAQAAPYEAAVARTSDSLLLTTLPEAGHFVFIDPRSEVWPQVLTVTRRLLGLSDK